MQILVVNGSPKGKGNTYKVLQLLEESMKRKDISINFEYLHLKEVNLKGCMGCYRCLAEGEEKCPLKDDQKVIEEKMQAAEALVFATPVYVMNVSWLFKNFLDRYAYICHRPRFHGKKALVLSTTGALGTGIVNFISKFSIESWGFEVVASLGAVVSPGISKEDEVNQWIKNENNIEKAAEKFYTALSSKRPVKAGFMKLCTFKLQRVSFGSGDRLKADYNYWKSKGWLEDGCNFYIEAKINPIKKFLADMVAGLKIRSYPKGVGGRE